MSVSDSTKPGASVDAPQNDEPLRISLDRQNHRVSLELTTPTSQTNYHECLNQTTTLQSDNHDSQSSSPPTPPYSLSGDISEERPVRVEAETVKTDPDCPNAEPPIINLKERLASGSSLLGTQDNEMLFDFGLLCRFAPGFLEESWVRSGNDFRAQAACFQDTAKEVKDDFEALWLDFHFFWDLMLRIQPNGITRKFENTGAAVDLLMDISASRIAFEVHDDGTPEIAKLQIRELRRRLQRFELHLRCELDLCGEKAGILKGCLFTTKDFLADYKHGYEIWSRMFTQDYREKTRSVKNTFRTRDLAQMLRLEDFMSHASYELERHLGYREDGVDFLAFIREFCEDEIDNFLPAEEIQTIKDMKLAWMEVLCNPGFRKLVSLQVQEIIKEAVELQGRKVATHREKCTTLYLTLEMASSNEGPSCKQEGSWLWNRFKSLFRE